MAQTQLAYQDFEDYFTERLSNTFRQSTIAQIAKYLGENDFTVKSTIPKLIPSMSALIFEREENSREISKLSALITNYRESLGNYNLNNIAIDNFNHLNDLGTADLIELFGLNLSVLLDNISFVSGMKQESAFTLLALIFPYILKQIGGSLPKGNNFSSALNSFLAENTELYNTLVEQSLPKLNNSSPSSKIDSTSLFMYFIILAVSAFFIFSGLTYFSKNQISFKKAFKESVHSITKVEAVLVVKLKSLVRNVLNGDTETNGIIESLPATNISNEIPSESEPEVKLTFDPKSGIDASLVDLGIQIKTFLLNPSVKIRTFNLEGIKFAFGSSILTEDALSELNAVIPFLINQNDLHIELSGHTDNTGNEEVNKKISKERADAVAKVFIDNGIPARAIQTMGYGSSKPLATNTTLEGRYLNRRTEMLLAKKN